MFDVIIDNTVESDADSALDETNINSAQQILNQGAGNDAIYMYIHVAPKTFGACY